MRIWLLLGKNCLMLYLKYHYVKKFITNTLTLTVEGKWAKQCVSAYPGLYSHWLQFRIKLMCMWARVHTHREKSQLTKSRHQQLLKGEKWEEKQMKLELKNGKESRWNWNLPLKIVPLKVLIHSAVHAASFVSQAEGEQQVH